MSLDDALFLVSRSQKNYYVKGSDASAKIVNGDRVLVQRGEDRFYTRFPFDNIKDNDLLLAWDGTKNRKVKGSKFKRLFLPPPEVITPPVIQKTRETDSWGSVKYELVSTSEWNRESQMRYGKWWYFRSGNWYDRTDEYGYYYYENNVEKVKYEDRHKFEGTYYGAFSEEMEFTTEYNQEKYLECVQMANSERNRCKNLCQSDYCQSICDQEYQKTIERCKIDFNYPN